MYKLMLADDEGIVRESLKFIVDKEFPGTFETFEAKTGRRVIELADEVRPDIAFMDIRMPGINGIDAMKEIRRTNPNIVFVVISAYLPFHQQSGTPLSPICMPGRSFLLLVHL